MSRSYVQDWIESLGSEPNKKRRRLRKDSGNNNNDLSHPYDAPYAPSPSPSLTVSERDNAGHIRRSKRTGEDASAANVDVDTPTAFQCADETLNSKPQPASSIFSAQEPRKRPRQRPSRPPATGPIKGRFDLQRLEKPVRIEPVEDDGPDMLPADIRVLYARLQSIVCGPRPPSRGSDTGTDATAAAARSRVRRIRRQAIASMQHERDESGWNNMVHAPLLELAFESEPESKSKTKSNSKEQQRSREPSLRVEPAMSASIARDSIPRLGLRLPFTGSDDDDAGSVPAWSAEEEEEEKSTVESIGLPDSSATRPPSNSDSRKVDYVVVVDAARDAPLRKTIVELALSAWDEGAPAPAHVNQTIYPALSESLIAVSIVTGTGTGSPSADPLLRLAIWVAAWHRRMRELQSIRLRHCILTDHHDNEREKSARLISLPLLVVTGHYWDIYFACDEGGSITVRGPLRIGSTVTDAQLRVLLDSLKAVKSWVKETFYRGMCDWFMCHVDLVEGMGPRGARTASV
ncbi:hypothetical protein F5Y14DRAFT_422007 [Nemania sp. NC0429]|nr:hypothetical protein F5Y14DRAFT_422007 [Nemania sp. NC0429]